MGRTLNLKDAAFLKSGKEYMEATGGTVTEDGDYKVHTFTSSGTFSVSKLGDGKIEILVVGGGGSNGASEAISDGGYYFSYPQGGGGGGGGVIHNTNYEISGVGNISVTVGAGGQPISGGWKQGFNGGNSVFESLTAYGGGGGGAATTSGANGATGSSGGCGGGGGATYGSGGAGTSGQGVAGSAGGGYGEYSYAGEDGEGNIYWDRYASGGAGGLNNYSCSITGQSVTYSTTGNTPNSGNPFMAGIVVIRYKFR